MTKKSVSPRPEQINPYGTTNLNPNPIFLVHETYVLKLEKGQFDCLKKIPIIIDKSYWKALTHMKIIFLQRRMERY